MTYSDYFWFGQKKNANSNLHVMGIICHWMSNLSFFPCTFTITDLSDSRRNPPKMEVTVCGSLIHRTLCWIYLFSSDRLNCAASIVRARYSTNSNLNQGITKRLDIFIFAKFSYRQRNPLMKNFKTKKNTFIISVTLTLPSPPPTSALSRA